MKPIFLVSRKFLQLYASDFDHLYDTIDQSNMLNRSILSDGNVGFDHYHAVRITSLRGCLCVSLLDEIMSTTIRVPEMLILNPGYWSYKHFPNILESSFFNLKFAYQKEVIDTFVNHTVDGKCDLYLPHGMFFTKNLFNSFTILRRK